MSINNYYLQVFVQDDVRNELKIVPDVQ